HSPGGLGGMARPLLALLVWLVCIRGGVAVSHVLRTGRRSRLALLFFSVQVDHFPLLYVALVAIIFILGTVDWGSLPLLRKCRETSGLALEEVQGWHPDFLEAVGDPEENAEQDDEVCERPCMAVERADGREDLGDGADEGVEQHCA